MKKYGICTLLLILCLGSMSYLIARGGHGGGHHGGGHMSRGGGHHTGGHMARGDHHAGAHHARAGHHTGQLGKHHGGRGRHAHRNNRGWNHHGWNRGWWGGWGWGWGGFGWGWGWGLGLIAGLSYSYAIPQQAVTVVYDGYYPYWGYGLGAGKELDNLAQEQRWDEVKTELIKLREDYGEQLTSLHNNYTKIIDKQSSEAQSIRDQIDDLNDKISKVQLHITGMMQQPLNT